jgi:hypothetical protein
LICWIRGDHPADGQALGGRRGIVYGKRVKRKGETFFKKLSAALYYRLLSSMSAYPIPLDTGDFGHRAQRCGRVSAYAGA